MRRAGRTLRGALAPECAQAGHLGHVVATGRTPGETERKRERERLGSAEGRGVSGQRQSQVDGEE